jgi:predicted small secreted protein
MNRPTPTLLAAITVFWLAATFALSGCNTVAGVGEDLETAGDSLEDTAEENKSY